MVVQLGNTDARCRMLLRQGHAGNRKVVAMTAKIGTGAQLVKRIKGRIERCRKCQGTGCYGTDDEWACLDCADWRSTLPVVESLVRQLRAERAVVRCIQAAYRECLPDVQRVITAERRRARKDATR